MHDGQIRVGEVQVDIRCFFAIIAEKHGKWNVVSVLDEQRTTDWANIVWQIVTTAIRTIRDEIAVPATRAAPMRRQRIDLRDTHHRSDERRADGTTRAGEVAIVV